MQGILLDGLERYAARELGQGGLRQIRDKLGRGDTAYAFDVSYPDDEITSIVQVVSEATGKTPDAILQQFGEGLVPSLLAVYGFVIKPRWTFVDFLLNTERVIHKAVRLNAPSAQPPAILAHLVEPDTVAITYRSHRRLCSVAMGIIRGCATHYQIEVSIRQDRCMLRGDPECAITVSTHD